MAQSRRSKPAPVTKAAIAALESLQRSGVTHLGKPGRAAKKTSAQSPVEVAALAPKHLSQPFVADATAKQTSQASSPPGKAIDSLEIIRQEVAGCTRCGELAATRTQTVFGVGDPKARLCFMGEAPGADEDATGEPFVGRAGQLLTKIIEACTLRREDVYILNVLKCRPPGNRTPQSDEVAHCRGYFERQLALIEPEFICCLGTVAAQALLQTQTPIGKLRGRFHSFGGIQVICTYHPSYLLRNPPAKKDVWEDMKVLMRKMEVNL